MQPARYRAPDLLAQQQEHYEDEIYPFFEEYCFSCHGDGRQVEAGINLFAATDLADIGLNEGKWGRVLGMLESGQMPPKDERQPAQFDRDDIAGFIEEELDAYVRAMRPDPGRVTARRLNRQEYNNTIRDLLSIETNPASAFPVDDSGYGFDNIGDVLSLSPLLMEKYLTAAENVVTAAMAVELEIPGDDETAERDIFVCGHTEGEHVRGCAKMVIRRFASRAYRRPVTRSEVRDLARLVTLVENEGDTFEDGIQLALN